MKKINLKKCALLSHTLSLWRPRAHSLQHAANKQTGYTLIELTLVLVVIGLLMGGVFKGQELLENARVRALQNEVRNLQTAWYLYQDRFHALPGDDPVASARWPSNASNGNGDGLVGDNTPTNPFAGNLTPGSAVEDEVANVWQHLQRSGIYTVMAESGNTGGVQPPHVNLAGRAAFVSVPWQGLMGVKLCLQEILGKHVSALESAFDDGFSDSGNARAVPTTAGATSLSMEEAAAALTRDDLYTWCIAI